jgi:hypothetical protein
MTDNMMKKTSKPPTLTAFQLLWSVRRMQQTISRRQLCRTPRAWKSSWPPIDLILCFRTTETIVSRKLQLRLTLTKLSSTSLSWRDCNSGSYIPLVHQTMEYNSIDNHDNSVTASSASEETTMLKVSILDDYSSLREGDSGYISLICEDNPLEGSRKRPRIKAED